MTTEDPTLTRLRNNREQLALLVDDLLTAVEADPPATPAEPPATLAERILGSTVAAPARPRATGLADRLIKRSLVAPTAPPAAAATAPPAPAPAIAARPEILTVVAIVQAARAQLADLCGVPADSVSGLRRDDQSWHVTVEMLELQRIPRANDMLATYEAQLDFAGTLLSYERTRRYLRG